MWLWRVELIPPTQTIPSMQHLAKNHDNGEGEKKSWQVRIETYPHTSYNTLPWSDGICLQHGCFQRQTGLQASCRQLLAGHDRFHQATGEEPDGSPEKDLLKQREGAVCLATLSPRLAEFRLVPISAPFQETGLIIAHLELPLGGSEWVSS